MRFAGLSSAPGSATARSVPLLALPFLLLVGVYRRALSPLLPPSCRFYPTCSHYAAESLVRHGLLRGAWLALRRVGRCHPWHPGGIDPVP